MTKQGNTYVPDPEELRWLQRNWRKMTDRQLVREFNQAFNTDWMTFGWLRQFKAKKGWILQDQQDWTEEETQYLLDNYRTTGNLAIAEHLGWGRGRKAEKRVWKKMQTLGIKRTRKETKQIAQNHYTYPDGTVWFEQAHGTWLIKVDGETKFYRQWVWENVNGPIPEGYLVHHKDWDASNCTIFNLELLTRSELAAKIAQKQTVELSDAWVAGLLTKGDPELRAKIKKHPELLEIERARVRLERKIKQLENQKS